MDSILWRRLDVAGHDACRLVRNASGWAVEGTAVFTENGAPARLAYRAACDTGWRTTAAEVHGWRGDSTVALAISRTPDGVWTLDGAEVPGVESCLDIDLGFTPATNLLQLRRVALVEGQAADVPVAWIDPSAGAVLQLVRQRYERRSDTTYWYESPRFDYAALLDVGPEGFIRSYPGLWEAEP